MVVVLISGLLYTRGMRHECLNMCKTHSKETTRQAAFQKACHKRAQWLNAHLKVSADVDEISTDTYKDIMPLKMDLRNCHLYLLLL